MKERDLLPVTGTAPTIFSDRLVTLGKRQKHDEYRKYNSKKLLLLTRVMAEDTKKDRWWDAKTPQKSVDLGIYIDIETAFLLFSAVLPAELGILFQKFIFTCGPGPQSCQITFLTPSATLIRGRPC
jgi:hypothetical protein